MSKAFIVLVGLGFWVVPAQAVLYTLTELGGEDWPGLRPLAINNAGQIVGTFRTGSRLFTSAFLYDNGQITDLGQFGGTSSSAIDINNHGQIVGEYTTRENYPRAYILDHGGLHEIGGPDVYTKAIAINDVGQVIGYLGDVISVPLPGPPMGKPRPYSYRDGIMSEFETPGPLAVNERGQILGTSTAGGQYTYRILEPDGTLSDLGIAGPYRGRYLFAPTADINDSGMVVGRSGLTAFVREVDGTVRHLEGWAESDNESTARAINNRGQAVGTATVQTFQLHAFLYERGEMKDLNDLLVSAPGWELTDALAINDLGQIVGVGSGGAFLLTPVPEPAGALLFMLGATIAHRRRVR